MRVVLHLARKHISLYTVRYNIFNLMLSVQVYKMSSRPKGRVLIININNFNQKQQSRDGSRADYANLQKLFKDMNFTVVKSEAELTDLTAEVSLILYSPKNNKKKCCIFGFKNFSNQSSNNPH